MLRSPCCVRYEQDDHADRPQVPAIVRWGRFCGPVPSPGAALTHRADSGKLAGSPRDSGHEGVDCRRLPTASLRNALNPRASQITHHGEAGRMPFRDIEQGDLADVRQTVRRPPTAAATAIRADGCGLRRAAAPMAPRSQTPANGPELRKQSLKLGGPDPRESKTAWRCPASGRGPWAPGRDRRLACSRLVHGTARRACDGRDDDRWGSGPCPGQPAALGSEEQAPERYSNDS
jgi:hypothetical protein